MFMLDSMAEGTCTKKILIQHEEDRDPVSFVSGADIRSDCKTATQAVATWLTIPPTNLVLKIRSEEWEGMWVNVCENDVIPDNVIVQAVVR